MEDGDGPVPTMTPTKPTLRFDYATPLLQQPWQRQHRRGILMAIGLTCTVGSAIGLILATKIYSVMSGFPVPGPGPVPPDTGHGVGDIIIFVGLGVIGILGVVLVLASRVVRNMGPESFAR
jgi:hypothetical protein